MTAMSSKVIHSKVRYSGVVVKSRGVLSNVYSFKQSRRCPMAVELKPETDAVETSPKASKAKPEVVLRNRASKVDFPPGAIKKDAINVYKNRWRVNIWTLGDNNARVECSWFVVTDADGGIISYS
jgi:hypothetical protein